MRLPPNLGLKTYTYILGSTAGTSQGVTYQTTLDLSTLFPHIAANGSYVWVEGCGAGGGGGGGSNSGTNDTGGGGGGGGIGCFLLPIYIPPNTPTLYIQVGAGGAGGAAGSAGSAGAITYIKLDSHDTGGYILKLREGTGGGVGTAGGKGGDGGWNIIFGSGQNGVGGTGVSSGGSGSSTLTGIFNGRCYVGGGTGGGGAGATGTPGGVSGKSVVMVAAGGTGAGAGGGGGVGVFSKVGTLPHFAIGAYNSGSYGGNGGTTPTVGYLDTFQLGCGGGGGGKTMAGANGGDGCLNISFPMNLSAGSPF